MGLQVTANHLKAQLKEQIKALGKCKYLEKLLCGNFSRACSRDCLYRSRRQILIKSKPNFHHLIAKKTNSLLQTTSLNFIEIALPFHLQVVRTENDYDVSGKPFFGVGKANA